MWGLAPRSSCPRTHPGKHWTLADALRVFAIRGEMRWCGKDRNDFPATASNAAGRGHNMPNARSGLLGVKLQDSASKILGIRRKADKPPNPFTPGPGCLPPCLTGRDGQIAS